MWKLHGSACCSYRAQGRSQRRDSGRRWMKTQGQVKRHILRTLVWIRKWSLAIDDRARRLLR
jgi:hypothetical protein